MAKWYGKRASCTESGVYMHHLFGTKFELCSKNRPFSNIFRELTPQRSEVINELSGRAFAGVQRPTFTPPFTSEGSPPKVTRYITILLRNVMQYVTHRDD